MTTKLLRAKCNDVKLYWKLLRGNSKPNHSSITVDEFAGYFERLGNPTEVYFRPEPEVTDYVRDVSLRDLQITFDLLNVVIEDGEIRAAIKELQRGKSAGEDGIINELFIYGETALTPYLTVLFNFVFENGIFPNEWTKGLLVPLHKKGSINIKENYRRITLLSVVGKLFTRVLNNRLNKWAESYGIYVDAQYGFRKERSTVYCIFILHQLINDYIARSKKLYVFFVDFSKAFDFVVRDNLWFKLLQVGVRGAMLNILMSMYEHVKAKVYMNGTKSYEFDFKLGVQQEECLSPFLFAMYLNDFENALNSADTGLTIGQVKLFLLLYADDAVIISETPEKLQEAINELHVYCNYWKLKLNTEKSRIVVFKSGPVSRNESWKYGDAQLSTTTRISCLGITFSSNGYFNQAQRVLCDQASKALFSMLKSMNRFVNLSPETMVDVFDKLITPVLCYAAEVWGFHAGPDIERFHLKFCKQVLGVKRCTQNDFVYGELGRVPMSIIRKIAMVKYWLKIVHGRKPNIVNAVYHNSLRNLEHIDKPGWTWHVRDILLSCGLGEAWYNQGVADENCFIVILKQRLRDIHQQDWMARLSNLFRARFYSAVKGVFEYSHYLNVVTVKSHRQALSRLLLSSHRLRIETGCWERPVIPHLQRLCPYCPNKIEDEFHLIAECNMYDDLRKRLIPRYYWQRPSMFKVVQLINSKNARYLRALAKYVFLAFNHRQNFIVNNV